MSTDDPNQDATDEASDASGETLSALAIVDEVISTGSTCTTSIVPLSLISAVVVKEKKIPKFSIFILY